MSSRKPCAHHQPLIIGGKTLASDQQLVGIGEIGEIIESLVGMRHQDLRVFLEARGDDDGGNLLADGREGLDQVAAHVEIDAAHGEQHAVIGLRAARHDLDIEPACGIGAIDHGLIIAAMLGLGDPVGAESHLFEILRSRAERRRGEHGGGDRRTRNKRHDHHPCLEIEAAACAATLVLQAGLLLASPVPFSCGTHPRIFARALARRFSLVRRRHKAMFP